MMRDPETPLDRRWLTTAEAALLIGVCNARIRELVTDGTLHAFARGIGVGHPWNICRHCCAHYKKVRQLILELWHSQWTAVRPCGHQADPKAHRLEARPPF